MLRGLWGCLAFLLAPALAPAAEDPALLIEIDRDEYVLRSVDLRGGVSGPTFAIALGSPTHPTPVGSFPIYQVVHNPAWTPGPTARSRGATEEGPSRHGPMGAAKLPFAAGGIALHGGADPLLLGKPVSLGCIRARDEDIQGLIAWIRSRGGLRAIARQPDSPGERAESLQVALRIRIR